MVKRVESKSRFEKKFLIDHYNVVNFKRELRISGFHSPYPSRIVNSIYFDDSKLTSYSENINGDSERTKYRLRYYGVKFKGKGVWEKKIKSVDTNRKVSKKYKGSSKLLDLKFPSLPHLKPLVHVSYLRHYYYSSFLDQRITIDTNISYKDLRSGLSKVDFANIVEIKSDKNNLIIDASKYLSNLSRSSKYCKGISAHFLSDELY